MKKKYRLEIDILRNSLQIFVIVLRGVIFECFSVQRMPRPLLAKTKSPMFFACVYLYLSCAPNLSMNEPVMT